MTLQSIVTIMIAIVTLLLGLDYTARGANKNSKTLRVGLSGEFDSVYPLQQVPGQSNFIRNLITPPVIAVDDKQQWSCIVCEKIPNLKQNTLVIQEDAKEKIVSYWKISDRYFWDDGKPVTGFDVRFTLDFLRSNHKGIPELKVDVDHRDPRKFTLTSEELRPDYYQAMAISLLPHQKKIFLRSFIENKQGREQIRLSTGMSYGPYHILQSGESLTLVNNKYYKGQKNDFETIQLIRGREIKDLLSLIQNDELDMIADGEFPYRDIKKIFGDKAIRSKWRLEQSLSSTTDFLYFNLKNPYLADQLVRRAILLSLDRESMQSDVFDNYGTVAEIPPFSLRNPANKVHIYDLKRAQKILRSSGWAVMDEVLTKNGAKLELDLAFEDNYIKRRLAERIRSSLAAVGIKIKLKSFHDRQAFEKHIRRGTYRDLALLSLKLHPDPELSLIYHSQNIPSAENDFFGDNLGFWSNKRADMVLEALSQTFDHLERQKLQQDFFAIYREDIPAVPIFVRPNFTLISVNLVNVHFPGNGYHSSLYSSGWNTMKQSKTSLF